VTRERPGEGCVELRFARPLAVGAPGQVAVEDYARALARAEGAEAIPAPGDEGRLAGVHLCAPALGVPGAVHEDVEAFAREMARREGEGLGWS
jgi:hypothetical protein